MALAFLTFPQIQELNYSLKTYISLEKLLKRGGKGLWDGGTRAILNRI